MRPHSLQTISIAALITSALFGMVACEKEKSELTPIFGEDRASSFHIDDIDDPLEEGEEHVEDIEPTKQEEQIAQAIQTGRESVAQEIRVVGVVNAPKLGSGDGGALTVMGDSVSSPFGSASSGSDAITALGSLEGDRVGEARGFGGLGMAGAGRGGAKGGSELVVGRGAGGMGMRGTGVGGGGDSYGRVGGLGRVDTGGGKGASGKIGARKRRLAAEVKNKRILGQIGARSADASSGSLVDVLAQDAKKTTMDEAFANSTGVKTEMVQPPSESGGAESYENHGVNPMTRTSEDRFSTFAIDVDTGSYTIARRKLNDGVMPPASSVRVEEFVNYFNYNYPQPDDAGPFGVSLEAAPSPFVASSSDRYLVRVGVQGKRVAQKDRKPVHLVFLVDVSGSMNAPDKLGLAKESLKVLTKNLTKEDTVALVTYAGSTREVLAPTSASEQGKIMDGIDSLSSGGGTAMGDGMEMAYKMAMQSANSGHVSRVIVLSDGDANIGRSSFSDILASIKSYVDEGVTLSTIGFGMGNYKDSLMEQLANKGNGNYYYIDSLDEARKVFGEQVDGTLEVIAKDVKIQVEFNPEIVESYRLVGYENRDIADKDFRNDKVDAGEIGAGHSVTAFYEVTLTGDRRDETLAYVRMRHKKPDGFDATEQIFMLAASELKPKLADASKDFQFGAAVATFAEILRGSPYAKDLSYDLVTEVAQAASSRSQKDRQEFIALVKKAKKQNM